MSERVSDERLATLHLSCVQLRGGGCVPLERGR